MLIPPKYTLTPRLTHLLSSIEGSKAVIDKNIIPIAIEKNIRRQSTLKSSLFSARIEGNPLTMEDLAKSSETQKKAEVMNTLRALEYVGSKGKRDISIQEILKIHELTMQGLVDKENTGKFRKNMEAIFNSAGIAIFMPPPPRNIEKLMGRLVKFINSDKETLIPVKAALAHYTFEKIHPFLDGSGRVGRLLVQKILLQGGYGMRGLLSFEEYIDNHRSEYYRMLEEPEKDLTEYLEFMLEAIAETAKEAMEIVLTKEEVKAHEFLLPRRSEIYLIIKDHKMVNFDTIQRRFPKVKGRTLRYDIKKLQDQGFVRKLGTTRGAYYVSLISGKNI